MSLLESTPIAETLWRRPANAGGVHGRGRATSPACRPPTKFSAERCLSQKGPARPRELLRLRFLFRLVIRPAHNVDMTTEPAVCVQSQARVNDHLGRQVGPSVERPSCHRHYVPAEPPYLWSPEATDHEDRGLEDRCRPILSGKKRPFLRADVGFDEILVPMTEKPRQGFSLTDCSVRTRIEVYPGDA